MTLWNYLSIFQCGGLPSDLSFLMDPGKVVNVWSVHPFFCYNLEITLYLLELKPEVSNLGNLNTPKITIKFILFLPKP